MAETIRPATSGDHRPIATLIRAAFGGEAEVRLVERLRNDRSIAIELIAERAGAVAGHIVFSRLDATLDGRSIRAVALAPVSVLPRFQSDGVGGALILAGHDRLRAGGFEASFVLGHPRYYPRFGYQAAAAGRFQAPFRGPAFMALALLPGALDGSEGAVTYPPAFGL